MMRLPARLFVLLTLLGACDRGPAATPQVVARVNGEVVLVSELREELERAVEESGSGLRPRSPELVRALLEGLIERRLLAAEARRTEITVTNEELEALQARRAEAAGRAPAGTIVLSEGEMKARLREQLLVDRLLVREVVGRTVLDTDAARAWYEAHASELGGDEQVRVQQVLSPSLEAAESVRREALRGVDFATLARTRSVAPDARSGGELGWFSKGQMPPELESASFALRKGQISEVVKSPWGFHVLKLVDRRSGEAPPFASLEKSIELELRREAVARAQAAYLERLRAAADIRVDEAQLSLLLSRPESRP